MVRWFRHYPGLARDEKLVAAALRARQPIERVVWVWNAILEDASTRNDDGRFVLDPDECAYFLRVAPTDIGRILAELEVGGRIGGGYVMAWGARQRPSDNSTSRVSKWRKSKRATVTATDGNSYSNGPEEESESESEKIQKSGSATPGNLRASDVIEAWNLLARRIDKPEVADLDAADARRLAALVAAHTAKEVAAVINAIERSPFLRGDAGWGGLDFSWVLVPKNFEKIASGKYGQ